MPDEQADFYLDDFRFEVVWEEEGDAHHLVARPVGSVPVGVAAQAQRLLDCEVVTIRQYGKDISDDTMRKVARMMLIYHMGENNAVQVRIAN